VRAGPREDALHLLVLWAFAVAQPLYDLLGRNPTFFVFHRSRPPDLLLFAFGVSVALPLGVWAVARALRPVLPLRWREAPPAACVAALVAALFLPLLVEPLGLPAVLAAGASLAIGCGAAYLRSRRAGVRRFLGFVTPVALVFPLLFLIRPGIRAQWLPAAAPEAREATDASSTPLLLVIFDALPTSSLLAADGAVDAVRYPNFARLAARSDWYRHATTVANSTDQAVPSLLTGRCPDPSRPAPLVRLHPDNLFTWLGPGREMDVAETVTALCPEALCGAERTGWPRRNFELWRDSAYVYLHRLLPASWSRGIPRVDTTWGGFGEAPQREGGRRPRARKLGQVERFTAALDRLGSAREPLLFFAHLGVPHEPYLYLPSGQRYREGEEPAGTTAVFGADPLVPLHSHQRHLLQVGFADRLLGRLLDRLQVTGLADEALLVVTSDHGTAFQPGLPRREVVAGNAAEVLAIPLFVKRPGQAAGRVLEGRVQTVDLLPEIAGLLGLAPPGWIEGRTMAEVEAEGSLSCPPGATGLPEVPAGAVREAALRSLELFTTDPDFPTVATHPQLLGKEVGELLCDEPGEVALRIERPELYEDVAPRSDFVPAEVVGSASPREPRDVAVAVAVNGVVRATTRTYRLGEQPSPLWSAIVPPSSFHEGPNRVEAFEIVEGVRCSLHRAAGAEAAPVLERRLGIFPVPGVTTRGLMKRRDLDDRVVRWGRARVRIEAHLTSEELTRLRALELSVAEVRPGGVRLSVRVNGRRLFGGRVTRAPWSRSIPLPAGELESPLAIEVRTLLPRGERGGDTFALEGIRLTSRLPANPGAKPGRKSR
jgi:hypothetical protein